MVLCKISNKTSNVFSTLPNIFLASKLNKGYNTIGSMLRLLVDLESIYYARVEFVTCVSKLLDIMGG